MKKDYSNPRLQLVYIDNNDLVCTSGPETMGPITENEDSCARERRNAIWDDYE